MKYMLLIKLLYLADREALVTWGRPIAGGEYFSMKLGPVLSEVLELVNTDPEEVKPSFWTDHIVQTGRYYVCLQADPGDGELSEAEQRLLDKIYEEYGHYDPFALAALLHEILPEWERRDSGRSPISLRAIFEAQGRSAAEATEVEKSLRALAKIDERFAAR